MVYVYDKPITIQKLDKDGVWEHFAGFHAHINKSQGTEYAEAGAVRSVQTLQFTVRYDSRLRDISLNTQYYRVLYDGGKYNIVDTDDYMMSHHEFVITGESYD